MTAKDLTAQVKAFCQQHADPKIVATYSRYFKEGYDGWGLDRNIFETEIRRLLEEERVTMKLTFSAAPLLMESGKFEETSFAIILLKSFADEYTPATFTGIAKWFDKGIRNWGHADVLAQECLSPFLTNNVVSLDAFEPWRESQHKFQRRCAAVAMIRPMKALKAVTPYLDFVTPMMEEPEREAQQGIGWLLREAWKLKREETEALLLKWKDVSPRLIYQYATEKMTAEEKKRFKKGK